MYLLGKRFLLHYTRGPSLVKARRRTIRQRIYFSRDQLMPLGGRAGDVTRSLAGVFVGGSTAFPLGIIGTGATPGGRGLGVKTHLAPSPYQALGLGGRSPPRPCCLVRHRRPGGDERNSKRPHGIGESGVCASSGVHCVHRPPTSHARSSTAQVVGFSSESRPHEPNRPPCVGALHQPPTRLPARTLRQRDAALHGGLQAAVLHEDPDITLDDGPVDPVDLAADFVVEFGGVGISRPVGEHRLRPAPLVRCPDDDHDFDPAAAIPKRLPYPVQGSFVRASAGSSPLAA